MDYGLALEFLTTFFGVTSAFAYLPQALTIWRNKSSADVSIFTFAYFFAGQLVYVIYGIHLGSIPIILTFVANMLGCGSVIAMAIHFRRAGTRAESG
ncbi:MAG TPA: PQ-loop domain-containing transporter [Acidobacteriota bacterium]|nr:PQ-loop domain-containing transporter [Acidobacteriota bacterium]